MLLRRVVNNGFMLGMNGSADHKKAIGSTGGFDLCQILYFQFLLISFLFVLLICPATISTVSRIKLKQHGEKMQFHFST